MGAVALVAAGAVALAHGAGFDGARPVLLALAPLLPVAGVAVSYGWHADPMHEIAAASPGGGLRLLLTRTAAVLAVSLPLLTAAGAVLPSLSGTPAVAAWLLPGLALTLGTLALGSYTGTRAAAATVATAWLLAVAVPVLGAPAPGAGVPAAELARHVSLYLSGPTAQTCWAAAAALSAGLLVLRRASFDRLENR
ncbi:hypothetical protein GUY61_31710 [Streptomyces sp. GC420]|nr:hypothetical protein [Streptomyces sp. GC420]